jgi:TolA-binding protein
MLRTHLKNFSPLLLAFVLTGCFQTRADIAREQEEREVRSNLQQNVIAYSESLEKLQADVGRLQGRLEEVEHERKKDLSSFSSGREGADKTIEELKKSLGALQQTQAGLFEEMKKLKEDNLQLSKALAERSHALPVSPAQKKSAGSAANYDAALNAYLAKNYDAAIDGFRSYLEVNPKAKRNASAHYYLGDSLYRTKDYANAIVEFGVLHERNAASKLGRKSTLRLVESFKALGKEKDAKAFAQILLKASPDSEEAKKVKKIVK